MIPDHLCSITNDPRPDMWWYAASWCFQCCTKATTQGFRMSISIVYRLLFFFFFFLLFFLVEIRDGHWFYRSWSWLKDKPDSRRWMDSTDDYRVGRDGEWKKEACIAQLQQPRSRYFDCRFSGESQHTLQIGCQQTSLNSSGPNTCFKSELCTE